MGSRLRNSWGRRVYLWLTTSQRDLRNRTDHVAGHLRAARHERDRLQAVNDLFHSAGRGRHHDATLEGITMQGRGEGLAWGFLILPALFVSAGVVLVSQYRRDERLAQLTAAEMEWERQLREAADKTAAATAALETVEEQRRELTAAAATDARAAALGAELETNLTFIRQRLALHAPPEAASQEKQQ